MSYQNKLSATSDEVPAARHSTALALPSCLDRCIDSVSRSAFSSHHRKRQFAQLTSQVLFTTTYLVYVQLHVLDRYKCALDSRVDISQYPSTQSHTLYQPRTPLPNMYFPTLVLLLTAGLQISLVGAAKAPKNSTTKLDKCAATALTTEFSAGFKQPNPPQIKSEFTTSFVQHRWWVSNSARSPGPRLTRNAGTNALRSSSQDILRIPALRGSYELTRLTMGP